MIESWMFYEKSIRIEMEKSATKNSLKCYRKRKWKKKDALIFLVNKSPSFVNIISSYSFSRIFIEMKSSFLVTHCRKRMQNIEWIFLSKVSWRWAHLLVNYLSIIDFRFIQNQSQTSVVHWLFWQRTSIIIIDSRWVWLGGLCCFHRIDLWCWCVVKHWQVFTRLSIFIQNIYWSLMTTWQVFAPNQQNLIRLLKRNNLDNKFTFSCVCFYNFLTCSLNVWRREKIFLLACKLWHLSRMESIAMHRSKPWSRLYSDRVEICHWQLYSQNHCFLLFRFIA